MKSSHRAFTRTYAKSSRGVFCKFTMINFPFSPTVFGMSAAGVTVSELPIAKQTSAKSPSLKDRFNSYYGKFYPKLMIESYSFPPQFSHFLEV